VLFRDLLWSDPVENTDGAIFPSFSPNDHRGCSYLFGIKAIDEFFNGTTLACIIRAHEAQINGFKLYKWKGENAFPSVVTVFSAPNYCGTLNNKGAIIRIVDNCFKILQFSGSPHPYALADSMDVFSWSLPFIMTRIKDILLILLPSKDMKVKATFLTSMQFNLGANIIRAKVRFACKIARIFSIMRAENKNISILKTHNKDGIIQAGLISEGREAIDKMASTLSKQTLI